MLEDNLSLVTKIDDMDGVRKVNIGGFWIPFDDDPSSIPDEFTQIEPEIDYISEDGKILNKKKIFSKLNKLKKFKLNK